MIDIHEIQPGWTVCDVSGDRIGEVVGLEAGTVHVKTGGLLPKDYYVPASEIEDVEDHRVELSVAKGDLGRADWSKPPA